MKKTLIALALLALAANAQAASWGLGDTSATGTRFGIASLNGAGDAKFGPITSQMNEIGLDSVAVGSWDVLGAVNGANSIDLAASHEAYAQTSYLGDSATARIGLITVAALDNAFIVDDGVGLDAAALAPAKLTQSFSILAGAGESAGMPVMVTLNAWADHGADSNAAIDMANTSNFLVRVNGDVVASDSKDDLGYSEGFWHFNARIGDTVTIQAMNQSEFSVSGLALNGGDMPYANVTGEFGATLNVSAVPEPETWAMLLMGVGLVGLRIRGKAQSPVFKIGA